MNLIAPLGSFLPPLQDILAAVLPILIAITFHEAAHGYVALKCGDTTALRAGRVSFNPFKHIDPVGTVLLPGLLFFAGAPFLFGYAKPVPVNFAALRNPRRDMVFVALAGPGVNILLAFGAALLFHTLDFLPEEGAIALAKGLRIALIINVTLALFNMLPIPPLDGGRVAVGLLPNFLARPLARLEKWGFVIVFTAFIGLPYIAHLFGREFNLFLWLLAKPIDTVIKVILKLVGLS